MTQEHVAGRERVVRLSCVALVTAVAGMLFASVFGVTGLLLPVGVPAAVMVLAAVPAARPAAAPWRSLLVGGAGLVAVVEVVLWPTTVGGLPTFATARALAAGVTDSWQLTLQSTWPARPEAELVLFVPLLVVLATALGIELLRRPGKPLVALAPSLLVAALSQLFAAAGPAEAALAALAYAAPAGVLLAAKPGSGVPSPAEPSTADGERGRRTLARAAPAAALGVVGVLLLAAVFPFGPPAYSVRQEQAVVPHDVAVTGPLERIAYHLGRPDEPVFDVRADTDVQRWRLAVLDEFDGVNWTSNGRYRRLGARLEPAEAVRVPVRLHSAGIEPRGVEGPWLPSKSSPASVEGLQPLVAQEQGSLVLPRPSGAYRLSWWQPKVSARDLGGAGVDTTIAGTSGGLGQVPPRIAALAENAMGGLRPTFRAALVLERFFRDEYRRAEGKQLPTGHSWPQLTEFLLRTKRGTSEQFATAYVALARLRGLPARVVVGFRAPANKSGDGNYTVRGSDVLAWPEVAVADVGWVPLDPMGAASSDGESAGGLADATQGARAELPRGERLQDPPVAPAHDDDEDARDSGGFGLTALWGIAAGLAGLALASVGAVPVAKALRRRNRRNRRGAEAVAAAWQEVRDRLADHGAPVTPGMTVRDLEPVVATLAGPDAASAVEELGSTVDSSLWSGTTGGDGAGPRAWRSVAVISRALSGRGLRARLRAAVDPRTLFRRRSSSGGSRFGALTRARDRRSLRGRG